MNPLSISSLANFHEWQAEAASQGGFALIDKQQGWTSFDVVAKLRRISGIKKVGHAGTLDPMATGLLIVCFGKMTKEIQNFQDKSKSYAATLKLGATTETDDAETEEENIRDIAGLNREDIIQTVRQFAGTIEQTPPAYSAVKINGVPAYKKARKGIKLDLKPRIVSIYHIEITSISLPFVQLDISCSKGTYIRSLARDIGAMLGCGAYLTQLRRTAIGEYPVADAVQISEILHIIEKSDLSSTKVIS